MDFDAFVLGAFKDYEGDEEGGTHAIRGFSFQVWWAVAEALKCYASHEDYVIILEWQQDVAIINSSTAPSKIHFIQLKKNESTFSWTVPALIKAESDVENEGNKDPSSTKKKRTSSNSLKSRSILSKLYFHRRRFKACDSVILEFISNTHFSYENEEQKTVHNDKLSLSDAPAAIKDKIALSLIKQLNIPEKETIDWNDFLLTKTHMPIEEAHTFVTGKLVNLIENDVFDFNISRPQSIVMLIAQYMTIKAGKKRFSKNFEELLEKGITKSDILKCMRQFDGNRQTTASIVESAIDRLDREIAPFSMCEGMRNELNDTCIQLSNRTSLIWNALQGINEIYRLNLKEITSLAKLSDMISELRELYKSNTPSEETLFNDNILNCLIAMVIKNAKPVRELQSIKTCKE